MNNLKRYSEFINESVSENMDEVYDAIKKHVIDSAISFAFEPGEWVYVNGQKNGSEGGDLLLWNDNKQPTPEDFDKFWKYVKELGYIYDDYIHDEWNNEGGMDVPEATKFYHDNLDGKIKDMFKEAFMKAVKKPIKELSQEKVLTGDDLYDHILKVYVSNEEESDDMENYSDEFEYYDNIIYHAVEEYISQEEPDREDDDDYKDEITDGLKNYWQPI